MFSFDQVKNSFDLKNQCCGAEIIYFRLQLRLRL